LRKVLINTLIFTCSRSICTAHFILSCIVMLFLLETYQFHLNEFTGILCTWCFPTVIFRCNAGVNPYSPSYMAVICTLLLFFHAKSRYVFILINRLINQLIF
jgi:hypothetical protein